MKVFKNYYKNEKYEIKFDKAIFVMGTIIDIWKSFKLLNFFNSLTKKSPKEKNYNKNQAFLERSIKWEKKNPVKINDALKK